MAPQKLFPPVKPNSSRPPLMPPTSRPQTAIWVFFAVIVGGLFLGGVSYSSPSKGSFLRWPLPARIATDKAVDPQPLHLDITPAYVAAKEASLSATTSELRRIEAELTSTQTKLASATERRSALPAQIADGHARIARLAVEIKRGEFRCAAALRASSDFSATIERRKTAAQQSVAASAAKDYEQAADNIKLARQERNEMRARIGARREDQSEAQVQSLRIRQARERAQQTFTTRLRVDLATIDAEAASLASRYASANSQLLALREERKSTERVVDQKTDQLLASRESFVTLSAKLTQLRKDQHRLATLQSKQEDDLRLARASLREKNELLAEQIRQEERRQREAITSASQAPRYYASKHQTTSDASAVASDRYDANYRPSVGSHYVRGYSRRDGTFVPGHHRTNADSSYWNNWSSRGNTNPYTGRAGTKLPTPTSGGGSSYVNGYTRRDGTFVSGHWRN